MCANAFLMTFPLHIHILGSKQKSRHNISNDKNCFTMIQGPGLYHNLVKAANNENLRAWLVETLSPQAYNIRMHHFT